MKTLLLLSVLSVVPCVASTCTGADPCKACHDCTRCRHCAIEGQSCGTMRDQTAAQINAREAKRAKLQKARPVKPANVR